MRWLRLALQLLLPALHTPIAPLVPSSGTGTPVRAVPTSSANDQQQARADNSDSQALVVLPLSEAPATPVSGRSYTPLVASSPSSSAGASFPASPSAAGPALSPLLISTPTSHHRAALPPLSIGSPLFPARHQDLFTATGSADFAFSSSSASSASASAASSSSSAVTVFGPGLSEEPTLSDLLIMASGYFPPALAHLAAATLSSLGSATAGVSSSTHPVSLVLNGVSRPSVTVAVASPHRGPVTRADFSELPTDMMLRHLRENQGHSRHSYVHLCGNHNL